MTEEINETMVENVVETAEEITDSASGTSKVVALGITGVVAAGVAVAAFVANKRGMFDEKKEAHRQKKIKKYQAKLDSLYTVVPVIIEDEEESK